MSSSQTSTLEDLTWLAALPSESLQAALTYHRHGWHPLPLRALAPDGSCTCLKGPDCPRPGKHPLHVQWTTPLSEEELRTTFTKHPSCGLGLLTGGAFWVLDIDGRTGLQSIKDLEATHGPLPRTLTAQTGSGFHVYFQMPAGRMLRNRTRFAPGLDTRAHGGLVVAPPSRHACGALYRYSPIAPLAPTPLWLLEHIAEPEAPPAANDTSLGRPSAPVRLSTKERARRYLAKVPPAIEGQGGDRHTLQVACTLCVDFDLPEDDALELLREWNQTCLPPWSEAELRTKIRNANKYAKGARGRLTQQTPPATIPLAPSSPPTPSSAAWEQQLLRTNEGQLYKSVANVILILQHDPAWQGRLSYDEFSERILLQRPLPDQASSHAQRYPRTWRDTDDVHTTAWLHQTLRFFITIDTVARAIPTVAQAHTIHPVRMYLETLRWDQTPRLATWLQTHLGAAETPYTRAIGTKWLISAIARIYQPGCKADSMLILEGPQGFKKSTALKTLFSEAWFTDEIADLGTKDSAMQLQGAWCIELAELDGLSRAEVTRIKAFLTRTTDRYRAPYDRHVLERPRQSVFAGTVNHSTYLRDETGGRRFWPVTCTHPATLHALAQDRDQLWAEALHAYRNGHPWWLESQELESLANEEQGSRYQSDEWEQLISNFVQNKSSVTIGNILEIVLGIEKGKWGRSEQMRVARCLTRIGWSRRQVFEGTQRIWKYLAP